MFFKVAVIASIALSFTAPEEADDCGAPIGADEFLDATRSRVLILGENHGTDQAPEFVRSIVCLALADGESVIVALEQSRAEQPGIDAYLRSNGSRAAVREYLDPSRFWNGSSRDGRSSIAMLNLVEYARRKRMTGSTVDVRAIDFDPAVDADLDGQMYIADRAMARGVERLATNADRIILLVGNLHARRTPMEIGGQTVETIGSLISDTEFTSVLLITGSGESWACRRTDAGERACGVTSGGIDVFSGEPRVLSDAEFTQSPYAEFFGGGYDRYVFLGASTASAPAVALPE